TYDEIMQAMNALRAAGYVHVALVGAEAAGAAQ
ncbi:MAG TPA: biopolymer transporter ExbD, partial [Erythrobacter sp.]|nr:biopolymer transporter ExbD [Erythrobacter sp.]